MWLILSISTIGLHPGGMAGQKEALDISVNKGPFEEGIGFSCSL